jgi:hypothetical protein
MGGDSTPSRMPPIRHSLLVSEIALPYITTLGRDGPEAMDCGNPVVVNAQVESTIRKLAIHIRAFSGASESSCSTKFMRMDH